jgi:hypothetical protein
MNTPFSARHYFFLGKKFGCKKILKKKSRLKIFFVKELFATILLNSPFYYERLRLSVRQVYCQWTCDEMSRCVWTVISFSVIVCVAVSKTPHGPADTAVV